MKQHSQTRKLLLWYYGKPRTRENLGENLGKIRVKPLHFLPGGGWVGKEVKRIPTLSHFPYIAIKIFFLDTTTSAARAPKGSPCSDTKSVGPGSRKLNHTHV